MSNALAKFNEPTEPKPPFEGPQATAVLRTRCGCEQIVAVPAPPPSMVTVELEPMPQPQPAMPEAGLETRVFYLRAQGKLKESGEDVYLYKEGPNPHKQIVIPKVRLV